MQHTRAKPGVRPQPAVSWLWVCTWFTEIILTKSGCVPTVVYLPTYLSIYLSKFVCTHPREPKTLK